MARTRPLAITWILPSPAFTGGVRVVYEHSRQLIARGHRVTLVEPDPGPAWPWSAAGRAQLRSWLVERVLLKNDALAHYGLARNVLRVPDLSPRRWPQGDVVMATAWTTAGPVADAPERCGRKANFLQHYEVFTPEVEASVDAAWRLPLERIVIASWLARLAHERFGVAAWGPVVNGVDTQWFRPPDPDPRLAENAGRRPLTLGMLYEIQPWKGLADGFDAIARVRREIPDLRLVLYGRYRMREALVPGDRYVRNPSQRALAGLYRACDLFLSPSWTEGCQLPPMEAMASGCAVVATEVGGIPDYAVSGRTVLSAPPHRPEALAEQLLALARDPALRRSVALAGREHIARFTWAAAADRLEDALLRIADGESAPRTTEGA